MGWNGKKVSERRPERKVSLELQDKIKDAKRPPSWWRDDSKSLKVSGAVCYIIQPLDSCE
jgi:hypothetical protein